MARYIDADALLEKIGKKKSEVGKARYPDGFNDAIARVRSMISKASTANVAPRAEVERQKVEIEALKIANEKMYSAIEKTKAELAMEIFEEIEKIRVVRKIIKDGEIIFDVTAEYAALKKKYTEGGQG